MVLIKKGGKWIVRKFTKRILVKELTRLGIKHNADDVIRISLNRAGKIIFLEKKGLKHIIERHADEFVSQGIKEGDIADLVIKAATEGKQIGMQNTRQVFKVVFKGKARKVAVQVGDNGYIVGANPVSRKLK